MRGSGVDRRGGGGGVVRRTDPADGMAKSGSDSRAPILTVCDRGGRGGRTSVCDRI